MHHVVDQFDRARRQTVTEQGRIERRQIGRLKFLKQPLP
jgi:hypothetical protein